MRRLGFIRRARKSTSDRPWSGVPEISCEIRVHYPPNVTEYEVQRVLTEAYGEAADEIAERFGLGYRPEQ
jgi:hypothetical protein